MAATLLDLPDEIIHSIIALLPVQSLVCIQSICRRLQKLSEHPLLWRQQCEAYYRFWHQKHDFPNRLAQPAIETNWKKMFLLRRRQDSRVLADLNSVLAGQQNRIPKIQHITDLDEDAKDVLHRQSAVPMDAEDCLARRWFSKEILGSINRKRALQTWSQLKSGDDVPIEHALGALDLFLIENPPYSLDEISSHLDRIASAIRLENPEWELKSPRVRASIIGEFIRRNNLAGVRDERTKHNLQNNLISIALCESDHQSLPIISVVIFCGISQRLGLDSQPCGFPYHVHAIIFPSPGLDMDDNPASDDIEQSEKVIYMDPYNGGRQISSRNLHNQLTTMGVPEEHHAQFMGSTTTFEIVARCGRNIVYSLLNTTSTPCVLTDDLDTTFMLPSAQPQPTILTGTRSRYAIYWLELILDIDVSGNNPQIRRLLSRSQLSQFVDALEADFSLFDIPLTEQHLVSRFRESDEGRALQHLMRNMRTTDAQPIVPKHRPVVYPSPSPFSAAARVPHIKYRVGLYFRHRRYRYSGMIIGWTARCEQSEEWMARMRVNTLPGGRHQPFYNVVDEGGRDRYVAEENIVPHGAGVGADAYGEGDGETIGREDEQDEEAVPSESLMRLAGRWFRRWDQSTGYFVSNIRDEYPDD